MSTIPGYTLEDFLMWSYRIKVEGLADANESLRIAEALGTNTRARPVLTQEEFKRVAELFEPHREYVERRLGDFDEESQSWRDYAGYSFDDIPDSLLSEGYDLLPE